MSMPDTSNKTVKLVYAAPGDQTGLLATESIMLLSVLGGVGSLPFLEERDLNGYWIVTLAAGILTILAGVWYARRQWLHTHQAHADDSKNWRVRLDHFFGSITPAIRSLFTWQDEGVPRLVLPGFAVLTGVLILLPALVSWWSERQQVENAYLFEIFFCAPAFLVWIAGAGYYAFPILEIKPMHGPQIAGLAKSGLQALSALLLWIYLGLSVGVPGIGWMFWSALTLAVIGGGLGIPASAGEPGEEQVQEGGGVLGGEGTRQAAAPGGQA